MALIQESRVIEDNKEIKPYEVRRLYCTPAIWGATGQQDPQVQHNRDRASTARAIQHPESMFNESQTN